MLIPSEVIKGGEAAVTTYLKALNETAAAQLTKRCKICVVGPSTWGKTTLVKSLSEAAPSLVDEEDRTIGIDLFSLTFPPEDKVSIEADRVHDGNSRYDVIFWDFAGQEIYQTTHAMFFSNRTLYLVCIHLQVYAEKLRNGNTFKPDAHFKLIGTKSDLVPEASQVNRDVGIDLSSRLTTFIEDPGRTSQYDDIKRLVVESDKRLFPAVWTISCSKETSTIELRIHSDLSGRCYHTPLEISTPNGFARFVADHATFIQVGISILSIASVAIPINVASTAVELTLSASGMADCATTGVRGIADRVSIVKTTLDRANLDPGKNMSSQDMATSSEAQMGFLKKLLTLHNSSFDEFAVSETANLVRATTRNGSYVWVHESELKKLEGH
ncbi:hypothetical protein PC118_g14472 [Phytophthora cactorum]|uniref:P-loop containing nucleoside triphosphate hydrolase n=1 Tax=Phytophthora cactorum TaxID=29920 RepID=A0A8T1FKY5_9STRA|nr:hypothetical protein PC118_g14472 [Phytophthora cactorum]